MTNEEVVREAVAALNEGDVERALTVCTPDIDFRPLRTAITGAFHGHDGVREFWRDTQETFDRFDVRYDHFETLPDGRVLATGSFITRGRGSAVETNVHSAAVFAFRDGLVSAIHDYGQADAARRALGA